MRTAIITRGETSDDGTFGVLTLDSGWNVRTGELPWRNNEKGLSSIPTGAYVCQWMNSPLHGWCYHVMSVPRRKEVEIHTANYCGDRQLGKMCDLRGCIALGYAVGLLSGQKSVLQSAAAIKEFHKRMNGESLQLVIHEAYSG